MRGAVKFFDANKGFGFITRDDGAGDVFLHASILKKAGIQGLNEGDRLDFDIEEVPKGVRATRISRE